MKFIIWVRLNTIIHSIDNKIDDYTIWQWNCAASHNGVRGRQTKILDLKKTGGIVVDNDQDDHDVPGVLISTMSALDNIVVVGGFKGECVVKNVSTNNIVFNKRLTDSKSAITNYIDVTRNHTLISSNDQSVRIFDTQTFIQLNCHTFDYCINNAAKNDKIMSVVGDTDSVLICDIESGKVLCTLKGHLDYSFASAWNPQQPHILATGSQDHTTRIWDIRRPDQSLHIIVGCLGAIRSLRYSEDGRFLAASEPADFVHIYDVGSDYTREQQIDIFGEISGISFARGNGGKSLFIGIYDKTYKSLLEFSRVRRGSTFERILL
jgi:WD40 repeat protein